MTHKLNYNETIRQNEGVRSHYVQLAWDGLHVRVDLTGNNPLHPNVFQADYQVWWQRLLKIDVKPDRLPAGEQVQMAVHATHADDPTVAIKGTVEIDGVAAGETDVPIQWVFHTKSAGRVQAGNEDGVFQFNVVLRKLDVQVEGPTPLPYGVPVTFTVRALDSETHAEVPGRVYDRQHYLGETNKPITATFRRRIVRPRNGEDPGDFPIPVGKVVAVDYADADIPWTFPEDFSKE